MFEGNGNKKDVLVKIMHEKKHANRKINKFNKNTVTYVNVCESFNSFIWKLENFSECCQNRENFILMEEKERTKWQHSILFIQSFKLFSFF